MQVRVVLTALVAVAALGVGTSSPAVTPEASAQPAIGSSAPVPLPQDDHFYQYDGPTPLESLPEG